MSEDVSVKVGLDGSAFVKGITGMADEASKFKGTLVAMGAAFGVVKVAGFVKDAIDMGDALQRTAEVTGISAVQLSKFRVAAELSDTSITTVATSMRFLQKSMVDAQDTTSDTAQIFRELGIDAKEALDMDPSDQLKLIGSKIAGINDEATRTAVSMKILGRSGTEMQPFFNEMQRGQELAEEFGLALGEDFGKRADAFNDNLTVLKLLFQDVSVDLADALLPALVDITNAFVDGAGETKKFSMSFDFLGNATKLAASGFTIFLGILKAVGQYLGGIMAAAVQALSGEFKKAYTTMGDMNTDWSDNIKDTSRIVNDMWDESASKAKKSAEETSSVVKTSTEDQKRQYVALNTIIGSDKAQRERVAAEKKSAEEALRIAEQAKQDHSRLVKETTDEAIRLNRGYSEFLASQGKFNLADKKELVENELAIVEAGSERELALKRELFDIEKGLSESITETVKENVAEQGRQYGSFFDTLKGGFNDTVGKASWWQEELNSSMEDVYNFSQDAARHLTDGFGSAFARMVVDGESFAKNMEEIFKDIARQFVAAVAEMIAKWLAFKALEAAGFAPGGIGSGGGGLIGTAASLAGGGGGLGGLFGAAGGAGGGAAATGAMATLGTVIPALGATYIAVEGLKALTGWGEGVDTRSPEQKAADKLANDQATWASEVNAVTERWLTRMREDGFGWPGDGSTRPGWNGSVDRPELFGEYLRGRNDEVESIGRAWASHGKPVFEFDHGGAINPNFFSNTGGFASGGSFLTNGPRMFLAGEFGPERITVSPAGTPQSRAGGGDGARYVFNGPVIMDEITMRNFARAQARAMTLNGQRYARR